MAKFVELVLTVLQYQAEGALTALDFLLAATDPAELRRRLHCPGRYDERVWFSKSWAQTYRDRQQFYVTLNNLKQQGLVRRTGPQKKSRWFLTKRGKERLQHYQKESSNPFSVSAAKFPKPQGEGVVIVSFDIPEKERKKRDWVRLCLVEMGFKKLQKSVWVSRGEIQEEFLHALRERGLLKCVHIFSVTRQGTIRSGIV